ncbi:MAG: hypothetical protein RL757_2029 [Bacteroidota bacterium]|jgi:phage tail tube protein FII
MKKIIKSIFLFSIVLLSFSCKNDAKKCRFGKPTPIFKADLAGVLKHQFAEQGENGALETVEFQNQTTLTLLQSGCDELRQVFVFTKRGNFDKFDDTAWKNAAIEEFDALSKIVPSFSDWTNALKSVSGELKLGQVFEIQPNIHVKIDKIKSAGMAAVSVELSQK